MTRPEQHPASNSTARKREAEAGGAGWIPGVVERSGCTPAAHHVHPDPAVRELVARKQAEALRSAAEAYPAAYHWTEAQVVAWLSDRADRLAAEVSS